MSEIITAAITGCVTLLGVLLSNRAAQAVTDEKLTELTREVREHNHFARRVPVVEEQIRGPAVRLFLCSGPDTAAGQGIVHSRWRQAVLADPQQCGNGLPAFLCGHSCRLVGKQGLPAVKALTLRRNQ